MSAAAEAAAGAIAERTVTVQTADAGPLDVHLLEAGEGQPVLMLHGWPQHAGCWRRLIPLLAGDHRLICPDLRGFGSSGAPGTGYDPATFASDAVALLDALELEHVPVVGHDWGGSAAFELALRWPERVSRLLVLNTAPPWVEPSRELALNAWRSWYGVVLAVGGERIALQRPDLIARALRADAVHPEGITAIRAAEYAEALRRPASAHATKLLYRSYLRLLRDAVLRRGEPAPRLTVPTRFLFGTHDGALSTAILRDVERHADDLEVELVEDSGHFIAEEKPELVAERARALFASS